MSAGEPPEWYCRTGCCKCTGGIPAFCPLTPIGPNIIPPSSGALSDNEKRIIEEALERLAPILKRLSE